MIKTPLPRCFCALITLLALGTTPLYAWAQNAQPQGEQPQAMPTPILLVQEEPEPRTSQSRIEYIHIEDRAVQIDELRERGETQSIEVTPTNSNLPAYEIIPQDLSRPNDRNNSSGQSMWRLFNF